MKLIIDGCDIDDLRKPIKKLLNTITAENKNLYATILLVDAEEKEIVQFMNSRSSAVQMMCEGIINNLNEEAMSDSACEQLEKLRLFLNKRKLN
jgi:hypothetical protein